MGVGRSGALEFLLNSLPDPNAPVVEEVAFDDVELVSTDETTVPINPPFREVDEVKVKSSKKKH